MPLALAAACVDERAIELPRFDPHAAGLLVLARKGKADVLAFEADAAGEVELPALTFARDHTVTLLEYGCSLDALELADGWQAGAVNARPLPESPRRRFRFEGEPGAFAEAGPLEAIEGLDEVQLPGRAATGCLELERAREIALDFGVGEGFEVPIAVELPDGSLLLHMAGFDRRTDQFTEATFLLAAQTATITGRVPAAARAGYVAEDGSLHVVTANGTIYGGDVERGFTATATLATPFAAKAWMHGKEGVHYLVETQIHTSTITKPAFYRIEGSRFSTLIEGPDCQGGQDDCDAGGVVALGPGEAFAVVALQGGVVHFRDGAWTVETIDAGGLAEPQSMALSSDLGVVVGSRLGGVYGRAASRWEALASVAAEEIERVVPFDGSLLLGQGRTVLRELTAESEAACAPLVFDGPIRAVVPRSGELVVVVEGARFIPFVSRYRVTRRFNRCP